MGSIADLAVTLNNAIAAFNNHDINAVLKFMAPGFTMVSVNPGMEFSPITNPTATQELTAQMDATFQLVGAPSARLDNIHL